MRRAFKIFLYGLCFYLLVRSFFLYHDDITKDTSEKLERLQDNIVSSSQVDNDTTEAMIGLVIETENDGKSEPSQQYNTLSTSTEDNATATEIISVDKKEENGKTVISPHDYKYLINEEKICANDPFLLIYIHTAPGNVARRNMIRKTWGGVRRIQGYRTVLIFLLGVPSDRRIDERVTLESKIHHDIIQEDYIDTYRNLTLKGIMGLKWAINFCSNAKFILKTDDDVFVNIYPLFGYLLKITRENATSCHNVLGLVRPFVKKDLYPPYCYGLAYVYAMSTAKPIYTASLYEPFFWIDDVFITGVLAKKAGVKLTQLDYKFPPKIIIPSDGPLRALKENKDKYTFVLLHDLHKYPSRMTELWNTVSS
ncbi:unnamed protein product [Owenia fusiformis]|uniref:Hexosyltransferase n=1 Tax=Owenia fusiformis TaxID=6347 RepID=A0A8J1UQM8_OWEFU|nr:unnamed protein product [Owenia fusiformis]